MLNKSQIILEKKGNEVRLRVLNLPVYAKREGSSIVAYTPFLNVVSYAKNIEDALKSFNEVLEIVLRERYIRGTLNSGLEELGWKHSQNITQIVNKASNNTDILIKNLEKELILQLV